MPERTTRWTSDLPVDTCIRWGGPTGGGGIWQIARNTPNNHRMVCVFVYPNGWNDVGEIADRPHDDTLGWELPLRADIVTPCSCPRHQGEPTFHAVRE